MENIPQGDLVECTYYHLKTLASNAKAYCARRKEVAHEGDYCLECTDDMRPIKGSFDATEIKFNSANQGDSMGRQFKKKPCDKCGNDFQPTGSRQTTCDDCKEDSTPDVSVEKIADKVDIIEKVINKTKKAKKSKHQHSDEDCEGCKLLQMQIDELTVAQNLLVAAGICTPVKLARLKEMAKELRS